MKMFSQEYQLIHIGKKLISVNQWNKDLLKSAKNHCPHFADKNNQKTNINSMKGHNTTAN